MIPITLQEALDLTEKNTQGRINKEVEKYEKIIAEEIKEAAKYGEHSCFVTLHNSFYNDNYFCPTSWSTLINILETEIYEAGFVILTIERTEDECTFTISWRPIDLEDRR